jgi:hypothetical protein
MACCLLLERGAASLHAQGEPIFVLHGTAGVAGAGPLRKVGDDWSVRLGGERPVLVKGPDFISLRREGLPLPPHPTGEQVLLSTGERLPLDSGGPLRLAEDVLSARPLPPLRPANGEELKVPLSRVAVLWLAAPTDAAEPDLLLRRLIEGQRQRDQVLLRDGDVIEGTVQGLDRAGMCQVRVGAKEQAVPAGRVAAVAFSTELLVRARPRRPYGHLVLTSGGRLGLAGAAVDDARGRLTGKTLFGAAVEVPLTGVATLDLRQGRAVYLSDLRPREYVHEPFLGVSWPFERDASAAGRPLRVQGSTYDKGLGTHGASRLTYDLAGTYDRFEAVVGLDDQTGKRGRVRVEVLVNGKAQDLGKGAALSGPERPLRVQVDVRKARSLTLAVHLDRFGDVQADVNWADARLIAGP